MNVSEVFCFGEFDLVEYADDTADAGTACLSGKLMFSRFGGNEQDTEAKDGCYPHFPLQTHLQFENHVYHNSQHGDVREGVETRGCDVQRLAVEALPRFVRVPNLATRTTAENGEEEGYAVEERVDPYQSLGEPEQDISSDGEEDASDEQ